jgi:hypothetical protein
MGKDQAAIAHTRDEISEGLGANPTFPGPTADLSLNQLVDRRERDLFRPGAGAKGEDEGGGEE